MHNIQSKEEWGLLKAKSLYLFLLVKHNQKIAKTPKERVALE
jgi:hypothetical protein